MLVNAEAPSAILNQSINVYVKDWSELILQTAGERKDATISQKAITDLLNTKVDKTTQSLKLYGTDYNGQTTIDYAPYASPNSLVQRTANRTIVSAAAKSADEVVVLSQAKKLITDATVGKYVQQSVSENPILYGRQDNKEVIIRFTSQKDANTIAYRDSNGRLEVFDPANDYDAVNKKYLAEVLGSVSPNTNLSNGTGEGSINQKGYYRDGEYKVGGSALGKSSVALNKHTTAYMVGDTAIGGSTVAGMTEDEFNAYYWDSVNNVPLHEGKGLINNKITDNEGRDYTQAVSCAFASGEATTAKHRCSFASGILVNTSDKEQAVFGAFVGKGGKYISDSRYNDEDMRFIVGCGNDWSTSGNRFALAKHTGHAYFPHKITIRNNAEDDMDVPSYVQMKNYADTVSKNYIYPTQDSYALKWYSSVATRRGFNVGANDEQSNKIIVGWYGLVGGSNSTNRQTDSLVFGQYLEGSGSPDSSGRARAGSATLGAFNIRNDDAVLTIGNGFSTAMRSNALTVLWDGRSKVQSAPIENDDVVRKLELDKKLDKIGGTILGDLIVNGDLTVNGTEKINNIENLNVKDVMIYSNSTGATLTSLAGLGIKTNSTDVYGIVYDTVSDSVKLGLGKAATNGAFTFNIGEGNPIAVRDDNSLLTDTHLLMWDSTNNKLVDSGKTIEDFLQVDDATGTKLVNDSVAFISRVDFNALLYSQTGILIGGNGNLTFTYDAVNTKIVPDTTAVSGVETFTQTLPRQTGTFLLRPNDLPTETSLVTVSSTGTHAYKKLSELVDTTSEQTITSAKTFTDSYIIFKNAANDKSVQYNESSVLSKRVGKNCTIFYPALSGLNYFELTPYEAPTEPSVVVNAVDRTPTWKPVSELGGNALKVTVW